MPEYGARLKTAPLAALALLAGAAAPVWAGALPVGDVVVTMYTGRGPERPAWAEDVEVRLERRADGGLTAPGGGTGERVSLMLGEIGDDGVVDLDASAIRAASAALVGALRDRGGDGYAVPDGAMIDLGEAGTPAEDLRPAGDTELPLLLFTGGAAVPAEARGGSGEGAAAQAGDRQPTGDGRRPGEPVEARPERDGNSFEVSRLELAYARSHPDLPPIDALRSTVVRLTPTTTGYIGPLSGAPLVEVEIGALTEDGSVRLHASGVQAVMEAVFNRLSAEGGPTRGEDLLGVYVTPDPNQLVLTPETGGTDRRAPGDTSLRLEIYTARVAALRTIASGNRVPTERRVNAREHRPLLERSPLMPQGDPMPADAGEGSGRDGDTDENGMPRGGVGAEALASPQAGAGSDSGDGAGGAAPDPLLRRGPLEDYAARLSRHPGRRVDVAVAPSSGEPGDAEVQYLVRESKPWRVFYQLSNTGVESVNTLRHRVGFFHNQLTNADDILSVDYITSGFDNSNALLGSYERPLAVGSPLKFRVSGNWSEFQAEEVGIFDESFEGESWSWSTELVLNVAQFGSSFVDVFGGVRYQWTEIQNEGLAESQGSEAIFLPRVGARFERTTEATNLRGTLEFEWTENNISSTSGAELERLGRLAPDRNWAVFRWDLQSSFYLEPLLNPDGYADPSTPGSSTLAHEIAASFRGQLAFGDRLIPNEQDVIGGLFSVRGYPESVAAGDSSWVGSLEYRFHLPRALSPGEPVDIFGSPFRARRQTVYGRPDWDLVFKGFWDFGRVESNDRRSFEQNQTLMSLGTGFDFLLGDNLSFRTDVGFVLDEVSRSDLAQTDEGDFRVHFLLTVLY